ncbi:beta-ketoacyl-ACP synthase II [Desulfotalea psychrophila]|uniref:3-oxoacyl-[acyl-carrier-protein] synthase 2 n=1 Tax=Desulfotalea psychrophila (strain LSv54 / DSM 12343) TaxID=177439 RepID=Q6AJG3_DESPS|nr:beta-ketoacyl-ACP synthase II [Desulfotalea psychrophila]CAG37517.1 probable 3-oxoacyl-[acyl-carrier-protein] synthase II [Desulfotalea psychrophila LSv54]
MKRRVVVTGVGLVTPLGTGVEKTWENLCAGKSGIDTITRFDTSDFAVKIAAEVKDFQAEDFFDKKSAKHMDLFAQYGVAAAVMALKDSGFEITEENCERVGVITGCGMGSLPMIEKYHQVFMEKGPRKISPFFIPMAIPNMPSGHISMRIGAKGPNLALTTACAAGTHAVGEAFNAVSSGKCLAIVAGGTESVICPTGIGGFTALKALSTRNDDPAASSRPFDKDRDGFVMAEGAGMLILEDYEHAIARGARIYAEMAGYGLSSDAYHITAPPEDGEGGARAMKMAIEDAGFQPEDIDYINAHGTSTPLNDRCETRAIKSVFGEHAYKLAISSTKSMLGHMLGATGGVEAVLTALSLDKQFVLPTINLQEPSPECDLDYTPNVGRSMKMRAAISNSFGFGGTNAVVAMKQYIGE